MKVVLQKTVPDLGQAGAIVQVSDAYARNFLLPQRLARPATAAAIAAATQATANQAADRQRAQADAERARQLLTGQLVTISGSGQPTGRLYQAIHADDVLQALTQRYHLRLTNVTISPKSLKEVGRHQVNLTWPDKTTVTVTVDIKADR